MKIYLRLLQYVHPYRWKLLLAMLAMSIVAAANSGPAWLAKDVFDRVLVAPVDEKSLILLPIALVTLFFIKGVFFYTQAVLIGMVGHGIIRDLRDRVYAHYLSLSLDFFAARSTGELLSRITNDVMLIQGSVTRAITGLLQHSLSVIALLAVVFYTNWRLALIASVVFPVAVYPVAIFAKKLKRYSTRSQEKMSNITTILMESITGIRIVQAFRMQDFEIGRFRKATARFYYLTMKQVKVSSISSPLMELVGAIGGAAAIYVGGRIINSGDMTTGDLARFMAATFMLYEPVKKLNGLNQTVMQGVAASERIFEVLDAQPKVVEAPDPKSLPSLSQKIEFRDINFSYEEAPVLCNLNLEVKKGEILAIVGSSGGGKSTLANLLPRFYDVDDGEILFDGIDIREARLDDLRGQIAMVTQQTILFNDTVRNNICYGQPELNQQEVIDAARAAYAHDFISELPEGYDTIIGEQGVKLSGGQRQRISIARALLKNAPILILDEATSSLDTESEKEVQGAIDRLMKGRTSFVIAHRLSTILHADRIIVISRGRIIESGSHQELYELGGEYRRLYNLQFADSPESRAAALNQAAAEPEVCD